MLSKSQKLPEYGIYIESRHERPDYASVEHAHSHPSLMYVTSGKGSCRVGKTEYPLHANSALLLKRDCPHLLIDGKRTRMTVFTIYFNENIFSSARNIYQFLSEYSQPLSMPVFYSQQIRMLLRQMLFEQKTKPPGYKIALSQNLYLLILQIYRVRVKAKVPGSDENPFSSDRRVRDVLDFIREHYYESHSLAAAARMAGLSQRQFSNICRKLSGTHFVNFLNTVRTEKAAQLLTSTGMPVSAVAFEVGYEDLSTFYRAFKKHRNQSPLDCRKKALQYPD